MTTEHIKQAILKTAQKYDAAQTTEEREILERTLVELSRLLAQSIKQS
jgi:hypothetical protein